jgi:hypothetical protein
MGWADARAISMSLFYYLFRFLSFVSSCDHLFNHLLIAFVLVYFRSAFILVYNQVIFSQIALLILDILEIYSDHPRS